MQKRQIDQVSFLKARKAQQLAALANGDVSSLLDMIAGLQQQVADLTDAQAATATNVSNLTTAFNAHTHPYTDVDNLGATLNKNTGTKN